MNEQARRGRNIIIAIIIVYFLLEFFLITVEMAVTRLPLDLPAIIRLGLSILLAYFLFMGKNWARWMWGVLLLLGVLAGLALGGPAVGAERAHPLILTFSCAGLIYFLGSAVFLFLSPDIHAYMSYQQSLSLTR